jgi:hypothetical protein
VSARVFAAARLPLSFIHSRPAPALLNPRKPLHDTFAANQKYLVKSENPAVTIFDTVV